MGVPSSTAAVCAPIQPSIRQIRRISDVVPLMSPSEFEALFTAISQWPSQWHTLSPQAPESHFVKPAHSPCFPAPVAEMQASAARRPRGGWQGCSVVGSKAHTPAASLNARPPAPTVPPFSAGGETKTEGPQVTFMCGEAFGWGGVGVCLMESKPSMPTTPILFD
jgi:hypothetical protein